jgi:hypothetical protein
MGRDISLDEVIEHFTLDGDEKELLRNKAGGRLGFAMMLKYLLWRGRFPRGRHEIPDDAIAHVARQIGVSAGDMGFYDVASRQARNHRAEIRGHTAFRVCTVADADKLWPAELLATAGPSTTCGPSCCSATARRNGSSHRPPTGSGGLLSPGSAKPTVYWSKWWSPG